MAKRALLRWRRFQIHAPREGRDALLLDAVEHHGLFQSTRPVKGATAGGEEIAYAPRVSIHAPREGRDMASSWLPTLPTMFQSTRPVKGATWRSGTHWCTPGFQSTRPVKGATRTAAGGLGLGASFNPRAP